MQVFTWHHRQLREAATRRYLPTAAITRQLHSDLADLFQGRWADVPKPFTYTVAQQTRFATALTALHGQGAAQNQVASVRGVAPQPVFVVEEELRPNVRRASEALHHLLQAGRVQDGVEECIFRFDCLQAKILGTSLWQVIQELSTAASLASPELQTQVELLVKVLQMETSNLTPRPLSLATVLLSHLDLDQLVNTSTTWLAALLGQARTFAMQHQLLVPTRAASSLAGGPLHRRLELPYAAKQSKPVEMTTLSPDGRKLHVVYDDTYSIIDMDTEVASSPVTLPSRATVGGMWDSSRQMVVANSRLEGDERRGSIQNIHLGTGATTWQATLAAPTPLLLVAEKAGYAIAIVGSRLVWYNLVTGAEKMELALDRPPIEEACGVVNMAQTEILLSLGGDQPQFLIIKATSPTVLSTHEAPSSRRLALADHDRLLVSTSRDTGWQVMERTSLKVLQTGSGYVSTLAASPTSPRAAVYVDKCIQVLDLLTGQVKHSFQPGWAPITALCFLPKPLVVLTAGYDGQIRFWSSAPAIAPSASLRHSDQVRSIATTTEGFVTASKDGSAKVWATDGTVKLALMHEGDEGVSAVCALPPHAVVTAAQSTTTVWDLQTGKSLASKSWPHTVVGLTVVPPAKGRKLVVVVHHPTDEACPTLSLWEGPLDNMPSIETQVDGAADTGSTSGAGQGNRSSWCRSEDRQLFLHSPILLQLGLTELDTGQVCSLRQLLLPMRQWTTTLKDAFSSWSADCTTGVLRVAAVLNDQPLFCPDVLSTPPLLLDLPTPGPKPRVLLCGRDTVVCAAGAIVTGLSCTSLTERWRLQLPEAVHILIGLGSNAVCAIVTETQNTYIASLVDGSVRLLLSHHGGLSADLQLVEETWLVCVQHKLLSVYQLPEDGGKAHCLAQMAAESWLPVTKARRLDNSLEVMTATVEGNVLQYLVSLEHASQA
jgi:hypothetical protein